MTLVWIPGGSKGEAIDIKDNIVTIGNILIWSYIKI